MTRTSESGREAGEPKREAQKKLRLLISPDDACYVPITERLIKAVSEHPDTFTLHVGEPGVIDHVAYRDSNRALVVWTQEHRMPFHRLTIRPGLHPVFNDLLWIVLA